MTKTYYIGDHEGTKVSKERYYDIFGRDP